MDEAEIVERLDTARTLLDEGRGEEALEVLAGLDADDPDRWLLALDAWTELGDWARAEAALAEARRTCGPDDPYVLFYEGRLHLARWQTAEARACLDAVPLEVGGVALLDALAQLDDLDGDHAAADALLARAHALDPDHAPRPHRLREEDFEALVREAASELPPPFQEAFETIAVVIDPMPTAAVVGAPASGHPPDVLGLFVGLSGTEQEARGLGELPPTIFLFQRNLERVSPTRDHLCAEVRTTLFHELGHALGFDEAGVDDLGLA